MTHLRPGSIPHSTVSYQTHQWRNLLWSAAPLDLVTLQTHESLRGVFRCKSWHSSSSLPMSSFLFFSSLSFSFFLLLSLYSSSFSFPWSLSISSSSSLLSALSYPREFQEKPINKNLTGEAIRFPVGGDGGMMMPQSYEAPTMCQTPPGTPTYVVCLPQQAIQSSWSSPLHTMWHLAVRLCKITQLTD